MAEFAGRPEAVLRCLPTVPGVYRFRDAAGKVLYIGRAMNVRRRVSSYWGDLRDRWHLGRMVARIAEVEATACASDHEAAWLERNLLTRHKPRWNRTPGGQEVPVYLRLHPSDGLDVVHNLPPTFERGRFFGPYLGGLRARQALSGLQRVVPIRYAIGRVNSSERDLMRSRGVVAESVEVVFARLTAILDRDPAVVESCMADLERLRDATSANLAFELAGKIQEEIEAVAWVVAEQRVTMIQPVEVNLHGWADGLLVSYAMRGGVVDRWTRRTCSQSVAQRLLEETPPQWREFAGRNAELGAALRAVRVGG